MANQDEYREEQTLKAFETVGKVLFAALGAWALSLLLGRAVTKSLGTTSDGDWLTTREACEYLKLSKSTLWRLEKEHDFGRSIIGGHPKYQRKKLEIYAKKQKE